MCDVKPGCRCATDTRQAAVVALDAYRRTHPRGPAVDPLTAASNHGAAVLPFQPRWTTHDRAVEDSLAEARSLRHVADSLAEARRDAWGDPTALAEIEQSEQQTRREYDATIPGLAALQGSIDHHQLALRRLDREGPSPARDTELAAQRGHLAATKRRLEVALRRAADTTRDRDLPVEAAPIPVAGAVDMDPATHGRWQHVDMVAQARTSPGRREYRITLLDSTRDQGVYVDLPAHRVEVDGAPHKALVAAALEESAGTDSAGKDRTASGVIRQARTALDVFAISVPTRRDA